jgi:hypothetical protein
LYLGYDFIHGLVVHGSKNKLKEFVVEPCAVFAHGVCFERENKAFAIKSL